MSSTNLYIQPCMHDTVVQGTWGYLGSANQWGGSYSNVTAAADGDEISWDVYLHQGTYSVLLLTNQDADRGIVELALDGVVFDTYDMYNAGAVNNIRRLSVLTVGSTGFKTLSLKINGKNGSSSGFKIEFDFIALYPTALTGAPLKSGRVHIYPELFDSAVQGTWAYSWSNALIDCAGVLNSTSADGDRLRFKIFLSAGTYILRFLCPSRGSNSAIVSFSLNGTNIATFDTYNWTAAANTVFSQVGITVSASGQYDLDMFANGHNGASGGYDVYAGGIDLIPTAYPSPVIPQSEPHWPALPSGMKFQIYPFSREHDGRIITTPYESGHQGRRGLLVNAPLHIFRYRGENLLKAEVDIIFGFLNDIAKWGAAHFYIDDDIPLWSAYEKPTLSHVAGGTKPQRTYHVTYTWYNTSTLKETDDSQEDSFTVDANKLLVVTIPNDFPEGSDAARVYVGVGGSGTEKYEDVITVNKGSWTEPTGALNQGAAPPSENNFFPERKVLLDAEIKPRVSRDEYGVYSMELVLETTY